jgi:regulatory protein
MNISVRNYGFRILSKREHSVAEFREKILKKFGLESSDEVEKIITEFLERKFLSNDRYCECFIRDKILKKSGPRKILEKLKLKGIDEHLANEKMAEVFSLEDRKRISEILVTKKLNDILQRDKTKNKFEIRKKITDFLLGRGFDFDTIGRAIDRVCE